MPGNRLVLVHYPDGELIRPLPCAEGQTVGEPVYHDGRIAFPAVDFKTGTISIFAFDCGEWELHTLAVLPLSSVKDCYNLRLHEHPLTLSRQPNDGTLELIWPERRTIRTGVRESFFLREGNKLYFGDWTEDPDYREEVVVRDAETDEELERLPGDILVMPNGEKWYLH